jgi:Holliday junction DNA helicase RuvA
VADDVIGMERDYQIHGGFARMVKGVLIEQKIRGILVLMIGFLRGKIVKTLPKEIILETHGVGYRISVTDRLLSTLSLGEEISLLTHLAVREDSMTLYGFEDDATLELFEILLSVSGIGPKSAMSIVAGTDPSAMKHAIALGDSTYLTKISGVGRKSAEKIILELKDKFRDLPLSDSTYAGQAEREALEALESLGYSIRNIRDVVHGIARHHEDAKGIIAESLKTLGKRS